VTTPSAPRSDKTTSPGNDEQDPGRRQALRVSRGVLVFSLLVFGALLTANYPLPWKLAAIVFALGAFGYGIYVVVLAIRAKTGPAVPMMVLIGAFLAGWMGLQATAMAVVWPIQSQYETCLSGAVTETGTRHCQEQYVQQLEDMTGRLLQMPGAPSAP
jgi:hypothetical protein